MSKLREIQEDEQRLQMTPMIDVTFLLLVFFMCTIRFKSLEGKLAAYLPKEVGPNTFEATEQLDDIDVRVELVTEGRRVLPADPTRAWTPGDGDFALVDHEVAYAVGRDRFPGTAEGRARVVDRLHELLRAEPDRMVTLQAGEVLHGDVVTLLDACLEAGVEALTFAGSRR